MDSERTLGLKDIVAAADRVRGQVRLTPCARSEMLSELTGQQVYLKLENLQMTGSFKERGALNRLSLLTAEERARGVVAASAGNHAQGVAYHATRLGVRSRDCDAAGDAAGEGDGDARLWRGGGAARRELRRGVCGGDAAVRAAMAWCFCIRSTTAAVIAGQGTIGLEMLEQVEGLEAVIVPMGGGGLIGGIACAVKATNPRCG